MSVNLKYYVLLFISLFAFSQIKSQDIHFSSLNFNPMFTNPSYTAFMNSKFRVSSIYRNQWSTVSKGYNTFLASVEYQPYLSSNSRSGIGVGLMFVNDVAGTLSYGEQDIGLSLSYFLALNRDKNSYISIGVSAKKDTWGYNSSNADFNREGIYDDDIRYEDLSTYSFASGLSFQYSPTNDKQFQLGVAMFNINEPYLSYFESKNSVDKIHRRYSLNASYMFATTESFSLKPQLLINQQYKYNEFIIGTDFIFNLTDAIFTSQIFSMGVYLRNTESIILSPKYKYNNFLIGLSYDVNVSKLSKVSNTYGGLELWLSYSFDPIYKYKNKNTKIPCPIF
ncbi:MAG: PorP/SprF family type IX secretion system membrane protein [Bacteroidales bacterium]|nr:PorP/SprF family type IX secretion system membrane protein [Bacteroidales bacterium]